MNNHKYITLAIKEAWKYQLLTYPNPAVGACIVKDNKILSIDAHKEAGLPHAEVNALKVAYLNKYPNSTLKDMESSQDIHDYLSKNHNDFFKDCTIYVTLEPCNHIGKTPSCAILLETISIKKVVIGTLDPNKKASGGKQRLEKANIEVEVLDLKQSEDLLQPFIKWQKDNFTFFKLAMREDGSVTGGYITSQDSLNLVHNIRTKIDLLVIGGNTVRIDKPTLDTRFIKSEKNPDILIYSQQKDFDKTIPLFKIPNRKISIDNKLSLLEKSNFSMIEGGYTLLENIKKDIDMLMLFISHKTTKDIKFNINSLGYKIVHSYFINETDEVLFLFKID